ncbi:MAG: hypothetical protein BGO21_12305 [Dyadobacter sp. 50-39]|uniref:hypothetical protein n=1 Tax=Dyadobacter sp. 50-39 TaxID=1895756 RepID=UPI0009637D4D|nr:hypothetical protein [Dyadobacter sp. 50-39]OJV20158.1 MAG: hypothetical protein BGO21_12305 [Dyadobacter sp. 50-39]
MKLALPLKKRQSILNLFKFLHRPAETQQEMDTTAYLMKSPANKARLLEAMKDIESGNHIFSRDLTDL